MELVLPEILVVHPVDAGRVVQSPDMRVEAEHGGSVGCVVAAGALEDAAAVVDDVGADVDLRVGPIDQLAVHPDAAGPEAHGKPVKSYEVNNLRSSVPSPARSLQASLPTSSLRRTGNGPRVRAAACDSARQKRLDDGVAVPRRRGVTWTRARADSRAGSAWRSGVGVGRGAGAEACSRVAEQLGGALVAHRQLRRERLHHDVVERLRHLRIREARRTHELRRCGACRDRWGRGIRTGAPR